MTDDMSKMEDDEGSRMPSVNETTLAGMAPTTTDGNDTSQRRSGGCQSVTEDRPMDWYQTLLGLMFAGMARSRLRRSWS